MYYFIADAHFGHRSILKKCDRPFSSVEEMDETMIANWNRKVKKGDTVYILGDLIYKSEEGPESYLKRLHGKKILIRGNHDESMLRRIDPCVYFEEVTDCKIIELYGHTVTLCHYPMLEWKNSRKVGSKKLGYLIHGHIHKRVEPLYEALLAQGNTLNAGVDINGFSPVSFEELLENNERFKLSTMQTPLEKALFLCRSYHMHQHDKAGKSYAEHPIYVASRLKDPEYKIVALLHDTLEDTALSPLLIKELFGERVLAVVEAMTHREGEDYFAYVARVKENPISRAVKIEDLRHNMDLSRLKNVTENDLARVAKYEKAATMLLEE